MRQFSLFVLLCFSLISNAQTIEYNTDYLTEGYDMVSYFMNKKPIKGNKKYTTNYNGIAFKFSSKENLATFLKSPEKYMPEYGGYCAYAIAEKKIKMDVDADTYEIRDGKLYLFYNSWLSNKLEDWKEGDTKKLQEKGDENWKELKYKTN